MRFVKYLQMDQLVRLIPLHYQMVKIGIPAPTRETILEGLDFLFSLRVQYDKNDPYQIATGPKNIPDKAVKAVGKILRERIRTGQPRDLNQLSREIGNAILDTLTARTRDAKELLKNVILYDLFNT
jgi:hypothetical protein